MDPTDLLTWCSNCLMANLSYYRLRRELFEQFITLCCRSRPGSRVDIVDEIFISIKSFLTSRNESLNDDKKLSFDTAVLELRKQALAVSNTSPFSLAAIGVGASGPAHGAATSSGTVRQGPFGSPTGHDLGTDL